MTGTENNGPPAWPPEKIEQLQHYLSEGFNPREIGERMGVTRNAIIGKMHRLGYRAIPNKNRPKPTWIRVKKPMKKLPVVSQRDPFEAPVEPWVPFMEAGLKTCRSIEGRNVGSHGIELAAFCSNPKSFEDSFCAYHMRLYYNK